MKDLSIGPEQIIAWLATYDYPLFVATSFRSLLEEFPASLGLVFQDHRPTFDRSQFKEGICAPARLGRLFGFDKTVPIIGMSHHDNHAWFSYLVSPFARDRQPVMIAVIDGSGDFASISLYLGENGIMRMIRTNGSIFELARNILQRHQLDAGRLDGSQQRRPLYGCGSLRRHEPFDQSFLSAVTKHFRSVAGRQCLPQPLIGELASELTSQALCPGAHRHPRATHSARRYVESRCGTSC